MSEPLPELQDYPEQETHEFVTLLLTRLTSHPEEYQIKWKRLIDTYRSVMTKQERLLVKNKEREVLLGQAHVMAMKLLLDEPKPEPEKRPYRPAVKMGAVDMDEISDYHHQRKILREMMEMERKAKEESEWLKRKYTPPSSY